MQCAGGYRTVQQETLEIVLLLAAVALNALNTRKIGKIAYKCFEYKNTKIPSVFISNLKVLLLTIMSIVLHNVVASGTFRLRFSAHVGE